MELIDTHTHLESFGRRGDLAAALERARSVGVTGLITVGTSREDWMDYRRLAAGAEGGIAFTAGLHPCSVDEHWPEEVAALPAFWRDGGHRPVALGECGLDRFHLPKDEAEAARILAWQKEAFRAQLALASEQACPVVVHSRGAFAECVELVDASGVAWERVVFHCFTEGAAEMRVLRERGGFGSFTGVLTYKNAQTVREAAREQGLDRLMLETDAPYLTPMPHRGKPNEPAYLRYTAECAADMFGVDLATLAAVTTANARRFYGLD